MADEIIDSEGVAVPVFNDDSDPDPTRRESQPKADPSRDAPVKLEPPSMTHLEAAQHDFKRLGLKSSLDHGCFKCGKPGSTFPCCNEVICDACARWFYPPEGHTLDDHLKEQPAPELTELQKLVRDHEELLKRLAGTPEDQYRRKIAHLKKQLGEELT